MRVRRINESFLSPATYHITRDYWRQLCQRRYKHQVIFSHCNLQIIHLEPDCLWFYTINFWFACHTKWKENGQYGWVISMSIADKTIRWVVVIIHVIGLNTRTNRFPKQTDIAPSLFSKSPKPNDLFDWIWNFGISNQKKSFDSRNGILF